MESGGADMTMHVTVHAVALCRLQCPVRGRGPQTRSLLALDSRLDDGLPECLAQSR